jgi:hypothetical protein
VSNPRPDGAGSVRTEVHPQWETTLDREARSLYQVKIEHAGEAGKIFETLMGAVVGAAARVHAGQHAENREPRRVNGHAALAEPFEMRSSWLGLKSRLELVRPAA